MVDVATRPDPDLKIAALDERVTSFGTRLSTFEANVSHNFAQLDRAINNLSSQIQASQKTPWGTIVSACGALIIFVSAVGGLAYFPIREGLNRLEVAQKDLSANVADAINGLPDKYITRLESERIATWANRDRERTADRLDRIEDMLFAPAWTVSPAARHRGVDPR